MAKLIETWLIDLAAAVAPPGRERWAEAMRAEFQVLERGRIGWALGCLGASIGWRIKADWVIAAGFVLMLALSEFGVFQSALDSVVMMLSRHGVSGTELFRLTALVWYELLMAPALLACLALSAYRPRYWLFIGLAAPTLHLAFGLFETVSASHLPVLSIIHIRDMNARLDVGYGAQLGYGLVAALIGRALGGRFRKLSSRAA